MNHPPGHPLAVHKSKEFLEAFVHVSSMFGRVCSDKPGSTHFSWTTTSSIGVVPVREDYGSMILDTHRERRGEERLT